ncbi:ABC transporter substrate-binding protein [Marinicrinis sediminis]|uniref:ABC transporter substrate-binding protein n=1 Tax=Marinicrinis sediminis TaxID=1652465 RepID=A0ABW5R8M8_9BACL
MFKKATLVSLALILVLAIVAGCGNGNNNNATNNATNGNAGNENATNANSGGDAGEEKTLKIMQFKVEIADQLAALARQYEEENPGVKIEIETVGGGADYGAALRAKFNSGDKPDIFNNGGFADLDLWLEHLEDLSNEPWVNDLVDAAKPPMTKDGKLYGQALNLEGYGYIYNKDLFEEAGITELPKTIDELNAVAQQLQDAGITPFMNGYGEWWVLGNHFTNIGFAYTDADKLVEDLNAGSTTFKDTESFQQWMDLVDTTIKYSQQNPIQTDYNTQVTEFALGEAAMMQQGNWTQVQLLETNPDLNVGFLPMPINNDADAMDKLPVGVPNNWVVWKESPVKDVAKDFLNWMVTSDAGKKTIVEEFKFIPAFKSIEADEAILGQLASDIITYANAGKTISWNWFKYPGGEATSKPMGEMMQAYIAGEVTRDQLLENFMSKWEEMAAQ